MVYHKVKQQQKMKMKKEKMIDKEYLRIKILKKLGLCPKCYSNLIFDEFKQHTICPKCSVNEAIDIFRKEIKSERKT